MTAREVHPVADLFPMLADDELAELAEDIRQRGLLQPIVLDGDGRVLDGRNRLAACKLAGVAPEFVGYHGDDPDGYALAVNIARRHLSKGQQAMVAARAALVSKGTKASAAKAVGVSAGRVAQAATVVAHAPDLADAVVAGAMGLDEAYRIARENKTKGESAEAQLAQLRADDAELADKVVEGELTLAGARAELAERERKRAEERRDARALLNRAVDLLSPPTAGNGFVASWADHLGEFDAELSDLITRAEQAAQVLLDLIERKRP
jgi:ParB-like chromosome segregation protein Spo0J